MWFELLVVIACGVGTFLLRFLPIWRARNRARSRRPSRSPLELNHARRVAWMAIPLRRSLRGVKDFQRKFFAGIGPAALTALLLVSLWPFFRDVSHAPRLISAAVALIVVVVVKRLTRSLAAPTLVGAAVYGVLMHYLTVT